MTGIRRTRVIAILATLAALGFAFSLCALAPDLGHTFGATHGSGLGVNYTFESYKCLGATDQYRSCRWIGTVTSDGEVEATDVEYRDEPPPDVESGTVVPALWSFRDPYSAWNLESSRAWLGTLTSAIMSAVMFLLMVVVSFYWWRKLINESRAAKEVNATRRPSDDHQELTNSTG